MFLSSNSEGAWAHGGRRLKYGDTQTKGWVTIVVKSKAMQHGSCPSVAMCPVYTSDLDVLETNALTDNVPAIMAIMM